MIRRAVRKDVGAIHALLRELAVYERLEERFVVTPADLERDLFGERSFIEALVAERDGSIIGCAVYLPNYSTFAGHPTMWLEDVYVTPSARGGGIGLDLVKAVARIGIERGWTPMMWACLDWNQPALDFYARIGAVEDQEWRRLILSPDAMHRLTAF